MRSGGSGSLELLRADGSRIQLPASAGEHDVPVESEAAVVVSGEGETVSIALLRADGSALTAVGSTGAVRTRGAVQTRQRLSSSALKTAIASQDLRLSQVAAPQRADASGSRSAQAQQPEGPTGTYPRWDGQPRRGQWIDVRSFQFTDAQGGGVVEGTDPYDERQSYYWGNAGYWGADERGGIETPLPSDADIRNIQLAFAHADTVRLWVTWADVLFVSQNGEEQASRRLLMTGLRQR